MTKKTLLINIKIMDFYSSHYVQPIYSITSSNKHSHYLKSSQNKFITIRSHMQGWFMGANRYHEPHLLLG